MRKKSLRTFSSPEPRGLICNRPVEPLVSRPRYQETTGSGDENEPQDYNDFFLKYSVTRVNGHCHTEGGGESIESVRIKRVEFRENVRGFFTCVQTPLPHKAARAFFPQGQSKLSVIMMCP